MENTRNIYLKINAYVIRAMYKELGYKRLHKKFVIKKNGTKTAYVPVSEILGVDGQRFDRIITTGGNNRITIEEAEKLSVTFNVDKEYFLNNSDFQLNGSIETEAWAKFFEGKYTKLNSVFNPSCPRRFESIEKDVNDYIKQAIERCENGNTKDLEILYRIYYYFTTGTTYVDDAESRVKKNISEIKEITAIEWKGMSDATIEETIEELKSIHEKLTAYQICKKAGLL